MDWIGLGRMTVTPIFNFDSNRSNVHFVPVVIAAEQMTLFLHNYNL